MTAIARVCGAALACAVVAMSAGAARADVIDGDWCSLEGKHFTIHGPAIVTPGGAKLEGNYTRHSFTYVVPANETPAGVTIFMALMNETTVRLREGSDPTTPTQVWRRCDVTS